MKPAITPTRASLPTEIVRAYDKLSDYFLSPIWDKMGLDGEALESRRATTIKILTNTLLGMKVEEEETLNRFIIRVESFGKERARLEKELGIHLKDIDPDISLVQLEKQLRHDVQALEEKKEEQMKEVRILRKEDEALCAKLEMDPYYVSVKIIPTKAQLDALKSHVQEMEELKHTRYGQFMEAKSAIVDHLKQLEMEPNNSFERMVVCDDEEDFILSYSNIEKIHKYLQTLENKIENNRAKAEELRKKIFNLMDKLEVDVEERRKIKHNMSGHSPKELKELQLRLDELEVMKGEKMEQFIHATRKELTHFWDLCYYSQNQRNKFDPWHSVKYTEDLLNQHEREVERLREYYVANEVLFKKVQKRQDLWRKMLELDAKQKDPQHLLKAKGKDLLFEERDRKRVNSQLPKVNEDLRVCMADYYEKNGTPFLVGGIPYEDFLEDQEENFRLQQEYERQSKQKMKKETNFHETVYGTKPVTPAARSAALKKRQRDPSPCGPTAKHSRLMRTEMTYGSVVRSPAANRTRNANRTGAINKSKYGLRQTTTRKVLGENNASVLMAGNAVQTRRMENDTLRTIDSDNFLRDIPNTALTSTMQKTPESTKKGNFKTKSPFISTPRQGHFFKTPSSRILTPANKSGKKMALTRAGRKMPFLI